jgi:membrane protein insertase Oxa1/YidC/SpoIIIJ
MENLGIFWPILLPLEIFMAIWYILWSFGIFPRFGILFQEKSGNPA